ncbi:hypothetical protein C486_02318 [Natrinema gari JCM 14663]|uniref:Uncharacterized protein n=1 Tax=Natrinema gari JCM 14663 TaxID=1230459 RepID=L9ZAM8_9EURY|nr:hypothetical protein C486_02318 [Natrinema gari JCM 14663]
MTLEWNGCQWRETGCEPVEDIDLECADGVAISGDFFLFPQLLRESQNYSQKDIFTLIPEYQPVHRCAY